MIENVLSSNALHSTFVLVVEMDLVVDMDQRLLEARLEANFFGQDIETQLMQVLMHSNCHGMDPKPSLKLEQNVTKTEK